MKYSLHTLPLSNSFAKLPGTFYARVQPTPFAQPAELLHFNTAAAELLDLDPAIASEPACADFFSGRQPLPGGEAEAGTRALQDQFIDRERCGRWLADYRAALRGHARPDAERQTALRTVNPKYMLRNYMAQIAIDKAAQQQDYTEIDRQFKLLQAQIDEYPDMAHYAAPPPAWARHIQVSCSS